MVSTADDAVSAREAQKSSVNSRSKEQTGMHVIRERDRRQNKGKVAANSSITAARASAAPIHASSAQRGTRGEHANARSVQTLHQAAAHGH